MHLVLSHLIELGHSDIAWIAGQLEAEGMGYLSPLATNLTAEGRERNRRVEVIFLFR